MIELEKLRNVMVHTQLRQRGISDARVLEAFRTVPREAFVPPEFVDAAYDDAPLPIGDEQTISQPYVVALTVQAMMLMGTERVLEIGTGSGYAAAILGRIAAEVYTVERIPSLAARAQETLAKLKMTNVFVSCGDGTLGWPEHAPYDAIAVAAGGPKIPTTFIDQLVIGGRLVMPVGVDPNSQVLTRTIRTTSTSISTEPLIGVRFVPLIGKEGFTKQPFTDEQ